MIASDVTEADLIDSDRVEAIAARLDLRTPNREALESIALEIACHYDLDREPPPFEAVVDLATGVGKTYVLASAIEYLAADGVRNFAVITPGRTILNKTVANFTPGNPKSLLAGMEVRPAVITSDNFATAAMRAVMDDPDKVKLFIFTVQALLKPESKLGRRTHKFQEGLGEAFYAHLRSLPDLTVFADEHHTYYGPAFSKAIRELRPRVLIGLTATPAKQTPPSQIIFRYPLAAAIADKLVKTPVLVGRQDDRSDPTTKLLDGVRLLEFKERAIAQWCVDTGTQPIAPMMLVIASHIDEANEIETIVRDPSFALGRYADAALTVHSKAPDEALAQLETLEDPASPYRIIISVGMLKEGWDVKNVYVIASLRASVSDILTEQTLGRGLRLPFGTYTDTEILDTLEVLGHERYEDLLRKTGILNEQFIDRRTRAVLRRDALGRLRPVVETTTTQLTLTDVETITPAPSTAETPPYTGRPIITNLNTHLAKAEEQLTDLQTELAPRSDLPPLRIPLLRMTPIKSDFTLSLITEMDPFHLLGANLAADPAGALRRVRVTAHIITGPDGLRHTEIDTADAIDRITSPALLFPLDDLRSQLMDRVLAAPAVPARARERNGAARIVDALIRGLGPSAETILSAYMDRVAACLIQLITEQQRAVAVRPESGRTVETTTFEKVRIARPNPTTDRYGDFKGKKGIPFDGFHKSLYSQDWFDSSTERDVANILDDAPAIRYWVRLQLKDLPILWTEGREYNPDFIAVDTDDIHWIVEAKMDKEMGSADVQAKRDAARMWAIYVSDDDTVPDRWAYLLVSETDVKTARGSWPALKALGGQ